MSAAVNDRPHEIVPLPHLPLTGELHPLRREFARWLATGNVITITLAVVVCTTIYFWPRPAPIEVRFLQKPVEGIWPSPPPIPTGQNDVGYEVPMPAVGQANIEPVDEVDAPADPGVSNSGGGDGNGEPGPEPVGGQFAGGGDLVIDAPAAVARPDFVPFDTEPVLISIDRPVYPDMVRDAGIDGTVLVRVFVALNGHVKDAYVVEGSSALREAAVAAARTAIFKPALAGTHPVEVWVVIPITFELRERY
jgi:protein TonB